MLRKLQQKVIMINMILVGVVLLLGFSGITANSYVNLKNNIDDALSTSVLKMARESGYIEDYKEKGKGIDKKNGLVPTCSIVVDSEGNFNTSTGLFMSYSELLEAGTKAYRATSSYGKIGSMNLYYKKLILEENGITIISFADSSQLHNTMMSFVLFYILVFFLCMVIVFIISYVLSKFAIKPVRKAWYQQQQFVADASHELKTPLTVILANNKIVLSHKQDTVEEQSKWVESSQAEANHMKNLVDNLLYLAKSDAHKTSTVFSEVPLGEIALDIALQFEPVVFEKGLELDYFEIDSDVKVHGDMTKLRQLIHILVDNACKYAGEGSTVKIGLTAVGGTKRLWVHNNGQPINPEDLPHIFERFYRSDKARTQQNQEGGYGLGLAIAKSIVDDHKGKITVTSTTEEGTKFLVELKD